MDFKGRITNVGALATGVGKEGKEWASIEVIVEDEGQYPNSAVFKLFKNGDNVKYAKSFASDYPIGTRVNIEFNMKAKEWKDPQGKIKFFQELSIWRIAKDEGSGTVQTHVVSTPSQNGPVVPQEGEDDLPF
jgi:hypothetical protein